MFPVNSLTTIKSEYCGRCSICTSVCPFEAISQEEETGEVKIDIEKCEACGICYSVCPAGAIEVAYYDLDSLTHYLEDSIKIQHLKTLILTCRGSVADSKGIKDVLGILDFIPLCLPCVGRIPAEFFLKALSIGIEKIVIIPCRDEYCHFKNGNRINSRKIGVLKILLQQFGYSPDTLMLETLSSVAHVDETKCTVCLTCLRVCKYEAPFISKDEVVKVKIDTSKCSGCGVCIAECPARAIGIRYERI